MKFYNKKKEYRNTWTKVEGPAYFLRDAAKVWCQRYESNGRFYFGKPAYSIDVEIPFIQISWLWYFENKEDAVIFKLVWT